VLEHIYVKRREAEVAQQRMMVAGPPEGGCAEELAAASRQREMDHLAEISKDLANLAKRPNFEVPPPPSPPPRPLPRASLSNMYCQVGALICLGHKGIHHAVARSCLSLI